MPSLYLDKIPIIRSSLDEGFVNRTGDTASYATGAIPRDYDVDPVEMGDSPDGMKLLSDDEAIAAHDQQDRDESSLLHMFLRNPFEQLDQNGDGYCWAYSTGHCIMLDRLKQNLPYVRINPHATAAIIKKGRDEGGWCGLSMKWARENGYAVEGTGPGQWPLHSRNLKYDTPELRSSMALHKATEDWYDLGRREFDQKLARQQIITLSTQAIPMAADWMRFAHSMCLIRAVRIANAWHPIVLNSWRGWGYNGLGVLYGMWPDNAVALRASTPSDR